MSLFLTDLLKSKVMTLDDIYPGSISWGSSNVSAAVQFSGDHLSSSHKTGGQVHAHPSQPWALAMNSRKLPLSAFTVVSLWNFETIVCLELPKKWMEIDWLKTARKDGEMRVF